MNTAFLSIEPAAACRLTLANGTHLSEELISLTYTAGCSSSSAGPTLGSTVAATFTAKLTDCPMALEGAFVTLEVQTAGGAWAPLGQFRFETPETGEGTTTVTAVDAMLWALEVGYYPDTPAPATALAVLEDVCGQAGAELGDVAGLTDVPVTGSLTGYTLREMAGYMAALLGRNALFGPDGKLELRWFTPSGLSITPDDYYSGGFTRKDYDWVLSGLNGANGTGEESLLTAGGTGSVISLSNPYLTQERLDGLWSGLEGFSYRPGEVTLLGDLSIQPGDLVTVTDLSGTSYTLAVMAVEHSYDGGWKTKLSSYGSAETDTSASYKGPTTVALERYAAEMGSFRKLFADEAYLQSLFVRGGIITNTLSGVEISASKYLTGVTIVGDVIQANTLSAEKLILKGSDGLIYELNAQAGTLTAAQLTDERYQQRLDGSVLAAHSVTADRINVTDLFAQDITATGTIRGVTLEGTKGTIAGWTLEDFGLSASTEYGSIFLSPLMGRGLVAVNKPSAPGQTVEVTPPDYAIKIMGEPLLTEAGEAKQQIFLGVHQNGYTQIYNAQVTHLSVSKDASVGRNLTVDGTATIAGKLMTTSGAIYSGAGVVAENNYGFYVNNTDGNYTKILNLNGSNNVILGTSSYPLSLTGSTITANAALTVSGQVKSSASVLCGTLFGCAGDYTSIFTMYCKWADGANHNLVERSADGLTSGFGWAGSSTYKTIAKLRSQTVQVANSSGTTTLSDERLKKGWRSLDGYDAFFDALSPQAFQYIDGSSGRYHLGFGAQSVERALADSGLDNLDFGGLVRFPVPLQSEDWRGYDEEYGLIYTEFVALLTDQVQRLKRRVAELEERQTVLERRLAILEERCSLE